MISTYIIYIVLSIGLAAFFSGSETAFVSVKFIKLVHLVEKKYKPALLVHNILKRPDRLLATTLIGTNISVVLASAFTTNLVLQFNKNSASFIATCIIAPLILIFGEIIPKRISQNRANQICLKVAPSLLFAQKILWPLTIIISGITTSLLNLIAPRTIKKNPFLTKDEIKLILRDITKEGIIEDYEREVIDRIFDFTLTKSADIMVALKDVVYIEYNGTRQDIVDKSRKFGFTRLPVFEDKNIKGIINIFDIFYNEETRDWHEFIRPIRTVSFDERLDVVFSVMQPNKEAMVVVLKDSSPVGILTMEDLIEEIIYRVKPSQDKEQTKSNT